MRLRPLVLALGLLTISPGEAGTHTIFVSADLASDIGTIPRDFVGFSTELEDYAAGIYIPGNISLINLLRLLGPNGVMRVGGWSADANPPLPVSQQMAFDAAAFLSQVGPGWKLLYGLDGGVNDPNYAVETAGYLLNAFGAGVAFQVWNEPNLDTPGGETAWLTTFNSYHDAVTAAYGPVDWGAADSSQLLAESWPDDTVIGRGGFAYFTTHYYWATSCAPLARLPSATTILTSATLPARPGWSIDEFGIICNGGDRTINGGLIAATYYLKFAAAAVANGWVGLLPHNVLIPETWDDGTTRPAWYNQFVKRSDGGYAPSPMFYAEVLFAQLLGQTVLSVSTPQDYSQVAAITATLNAAGNANILVTNINPRQSFEVRPDQSAPWSTAAVLTLSGQGCADRNPTLGGAPIDEGGTWAGTWWQLSHGQTVTVSPCGAALIEIQ